MSLADELLADFEELGDDGEEETRNEAGGGAEEDEQLEVEMMMVGKLSVHQIAKLRDSGQVCLLKNLLHSWNISRQSSLLHSLCRLLVQCFFV